MPLGRDQGVGAVIWSPLAWGKLTGKIRRGQPAQPGTRAHGIPAGGPKYEEERLFRVVDALDAVAKETGKSIPQVALNWLLQRPTVATILIGARNEGQLVENIGAVGWAVERGAHDRARTRRARRHLPTPCGTSAASRC